MKNCADLTLECKHRNYPCKLYDKSVGTPQFVPPDPDDDDELQKNAKEYKKITIQMLKHMMKRRKTRAFSLFFKILKMKFTPTSMIRKRLYSISPKFAIRKPEQLQQQTSNIL